MEVTRDTFKDSNNSTQNLILFDTMMDFGSKLDGFNSSCDDKHTQIHADIKRSGKVNKGLSSGSGLLGGFLAVIVSKVMGM